MPHPTRNWYDDAERAPLCRAQTLEDPQTFYERLVAMEAEEAPEKPFVSAVTQEEQQERRQQFYAENGRGERERSDREEHGTYQVVNGKGW